MVQPALSQGFGYGIILGLGAVFGVYIELEELWGFVLTTSIQLLE